MTKEYAKIGEYTAVEAMVCHSARFLANFDGKKGLIGTGLPLVASQLAKMLYSPNMIIFVETGQADANPQNSYIHYGQPANLRIILADGRPGRTLSIKPQ